MRVVDTYQGLVLAGSGLGGMLLSCLSALAWGFLGLVAELEGRKCDVVRCEGRACEMGRSGIEYGVLRD